MDEFPAQSHKSREPKVIQQVTSEPGRVRKAPAGRRFRDTFIQGTPKSVVGSMIWDVFLPGMRDNLADAIHDGIDSLFRGDSSGISRRTRSRYSSNHSSISKHSPDRALGGASRPSSDRYSDDARRNQDVSVIEIDSRVEAQEVLNQMLALIDQFDVCTLADFYQLVGIPPDHTDFKFGWEDIGGAHVVSSRGAYYLDIPRPNELRR